MGGSMLKKLFLGLLGASSLAFPFEKIAPVDANREVADGRALLFDVRELEELKETGFAKPAIHFAKSSIDAKDAHYKEVLATLPKEKLLVFYCRSGKRSGVVADYFTDLGFQTRNMGSLSDWKQAGLPVSQLPNLR